MFFLNFYKNVFKKKYLKSHCMIFLNLNVKKQVEKYEENIII